jgi:hypothetical protein
MSTTTKITGPVNENIATYRYIEDDTQRKQFK